ncbi:Endonuclease/exonuclease/phosphatase family domain-containing protein 1 [Actinoplanes sp. SE50]|uniref:ComEA family DNA-binding protein n=1 Tax=unclassified Actinoplanes TaxID=2626549 RepID=UPI00023ECAFF|nr:MULTISPECIES: helix-hairpin-helix domain-containing protein [unclassified Actinoplanes]AEV83751.1 Endonuclease/exonuclease/phosphatase family domain-containing protein 1 [Actinoplanes sp. SE50/110]ATO82105.1 Endonuclease/exonuclease/phosphatase family domain-containing protein 1 [Actinoplanes sp. SE50]SLL99512.1 Endonuclease/exonuclease/phosphatase family domain-containing protein 1 [Actinoplanes sp. SE50/110]
MTWTPPDGTGPYQPPPPAGPGAGWRIGHSMWLFFPILGFGCLSGGGFLYVGLRAHRPAWWIPGIVYSVLSIAGFTIGGSAPTDSLRQNLSYAVLFGAWLVSIFHAALINGAWLRWLAGYQAWQAQMRAVWVGQQPTSFAPLPPYLQGVVAPPQQFYNTAPGYQPAPVPQPAVHQPSTPAQVDVNTATEQQLATLPGLTPGRIAQVLQSRQQRRGFLTVDDFAAAAGLAPHEFVAIRDRLTCSAAPPPPDDTTSGPYGRVVDV